MVSECVEHRSRRHRDRDDDREESAAEHVPREDEPARRAAERDERREDAGADAGGDVEVRTGERHCIRHHPRARRLVHDELERETKRLEADEQKEGRSLREDRTYPRPREEDGGCCDGDEEDDERRRARVEASEHPRSRREPGRPQPDRDAERSPGRVSPRAGEPERRRRASDCADEERGEEERDRGDAVEDERGRSGLHPPIERVNRLRLQG